MKIFKGVLKVFGFLAKIALVIAAVNFAFSFIEERIHKKVPEGGRYFAWKHGRIFYHKRGHGDPVIILHGFEPSQSGKDFVSLSQHLSSNHTVYSIDLLGFGLSDKPWITYTNYLYVLLIQDFIKEITGKVTDIIACGGSGLCALQAYKDDPSMIGKIVLVDPCYNERFHLSKFFALKLKTLIDLPVIGTFIYNLYSLTGKAPFDKEGRHVFTSLLGGYLTTDLTPHADLVSSSTAVFKKSPEETFTFGDVKSSLI